MSNSPVSALILAAGKGTRMKSDKAKVLHEVFFAPMIHHVLDAVRPLSLDATVLVTGHQRRRVEDALKEYEVLFVEQQEQLGTGHAVLAAKKILKEKGGTVLILCGDTPLIRSDTLQDMLNGHMAQSAPLTVMTTIVDDPTNYGRIVSDSTGNLKRIVEEKDASVEQREINEINAGIYCVAADFLLRALQNVGTDNQQGEVYLTDIVAVANEAGHKVNKFVCPDPVEVLGVNSRIELAQAHELLQNRHNRELMANGVTLMQPGTANIEKTAAIGRDTFIHPNVVITGNTVIGEGCTIEPFTVIRGSRLGDGVTVGAFSYLERCSVAGGEEVKPGTVIRKA